MSGLSNRPLFNFFKRGLSNMGVSSMGGYLPDSTVVYFSSNTDKMLLHPECGRLELRPTKSRMRGLNANFGDQIANGYSFIVIPELWTCSSRAIVSPHYYC